MIYLYCLLIISYTLTATYSHDSFESCFGSSCSENLNKYSKEINEWESNLEKEIKIAEEQYKPCDKMNCSCHKTVIEQDLAPYTDGITEDQFAMARSKATKYQIINGVLYREKDCHFPARCAGVEHYLKALASKLPDMEIALNTRDWPQVNSAWGHKKAPVFSFSKMRCYYQGLGWLPHIYVSQLSRTRIWLPMIADKTIETKDYYDIMYPTWSFWEGGPAISLYPTGIGRWDKHRLSISSAAEKWPWEKKEAKAFFRGSRTSEERDALVLLSRSQPALVDAQYTKNQAWKSDADTLYASPASEVPFEEHCKYKYLFNYRGVAASFRFKHLFLCKSLVFHVGDEWLEFFYPSLKPWVHYVPISPKATQSDLVKYIEYFKVHDSLAKEIANRGFEHIWDNLTDKDVKCYWKKLLKKYAKLVKYEVRKDNDLIKV